MRRRKTGRECLTKACPVLTFARDRLRAAPNLFGSRKHRPLQPAPVTRTAWHTHPLGQTLIVTAGLGSVQLEGGLIEKISPGDVVWFPPDEKHWHGASPTIALTHIAIQEALGDKVVE